ncbi:unnamed protein product, partial [Polarella glacialis]
AAAISACEKAADLGPATAAMELFGLMRRRGPVPDVVVLNSVLSACCKGLQWAWALQLFAEVALNKDGSRGNIRGSLQPDAVTYATGMAACRLGRCWQEAAQLLTLMQ